MHEKWDYLTAFWHPASYTVWSVSFSVSCRTGIGSSLYNASLKMFSLFLPYADQRESRRWLSSCQVSWRPLAELEVFQTCCRKRSSGFHGFGMLLQASQGWLLYCSLPEGPVHTSCFGSCLPFFALLIPCSQAGSFTGNTECSLNFLVQEPTFPFGSGSGA